MSNKSNGSKYEQILAEMLAAKGWWVHLLTQSKAGQPADVIAVKNGVTVLIDSKVCHSNRFDLRRVEENQRLAMTHWAVCGNGTAWFALWFPNDDCRFVSYETILKLWDAGCGAVFKDTLKLGFDEWEEGICESW